MRVRDWGGSSIRDSELERVAALFLCRRGKDGEGRLYIGGETHTWTASIHRFFGLELSAHEVPSSVDFVQRASPGHSL